MFEGGVVRWTFVQTGADEVGRAVESIDQKVQRAARNSEQSAARKVHSERDAQARITTATAKGMAQREAASERAYQKIVRQFEREAAMAEKAAGREAKSADKAAKARVESFKKASEKIWGPNGLVARDNAQRARQQSKQLAEEKRNAEAVQKAREARVGSFLGGVGGIAAGIGRGALSLAGAASMAALGTIGSAARSGMQLHETSTRLALQGRAPGEAIQDPRQLSRSFERTALSTPGVSAQDVAEAVGAFVTKTGDLKAAQGFQETFARTAVAAGANVQDIAGTGADLFQKFNIKGVEEMQEAFGVLLQQGKSGAFELKDAAAEMAEMAAAANNFGIGSGPDAVKTLGGLAQVARMATGSGAEAKTSVQALFKALTTDSDKLKKEGVNVFDEKGQARNIVDVITESIGQVGGSDMEEKKVKLQKIFDIRGIRAISPLIQKFNEAQQGTKGTDEEKVAAGMAAVRAELQRFIDTPGKWGDVMEDFSVASQMSSSVVTQAMEQLKASVAEQVVPQIIELVPKLMELTGKMGPLIEGFGLLLDAMNGVVDYLKEAGVLKEKPKGPAKRGIAAAFAEEQLYRTGETNIEFNRQFDKWGREMQEVPADMNSDDFVAAMAAAGNGDTSGFQDPRYFEQIAQDILTDPTAARTSIDRDNYGGLISGGPAAYHGLTDQQKQIAGTFAEQVYSNMSPEGRAAAGGSAPAMKGMAEIDETSKRAAQSLAGLVPAFRKLAEAAKKDEGGDIGGDLP